MGFIASPLKPVTLLPPDLMIVYTLELISHCPIDHGQAFVSPFHAVPLLLPRKGAAVKTAKTLAKQIK